MFLSRTPFKWIINEVIKLSQWIFLLEVFFHESIRIKVQWWWIAMVDAYLLSWLHTYTRDDEANQGSVHTETFSCVFVLFIVLKGIENNQLITWYNTKNAGKRFRVYGGPQTHVLERIFTNFFYKSFFFFVLETAHRKLELVV